MGGRGFACLTPNNGSKLIELKFEKNNYDSAKIIMNCNASTCDTLQRLAFYARVASAVRNDIRNSEGRVLIVMIH